MIRLEESKIGSIVWSFWEKGQGIRIYNSVIALQILWRFSHPVLTVNLSTVLDTDDGNFVLCVIAKGFLSMIAT